MSNRSDVGRPMELFMCSVVLRVGYRQGFRWLAQYVSNIEGLLTTHATR